MPTPDWSPPTEENAKLGGRMDAISCGTPPVKASAKSRTMVAENWLPWAAAVRFPLPSPEFQPPPDADGWPWQIADGLRLRGWNLRHVWGNFFLRDSGAIRNVEFTADGRFIHAEGASRRLWDVASAREMAAEGKIPPFAEDRKNSFIWPDGRSIHANAGDTGIFFFRTESPDDVRILRAGRPVQCVAGSQSGTRIFAGLDNGQVVEWDVATLAKVAVHRPHKAAVTQIVPLRDGKRMVTASWDCTAKLWWLRERQSPMIFAAHQSPVNAAAVSPDESLAITGGDDGAVRVWDLRSGQEIRGQNPHDGPVLDMAFSADSSLVHTFELREGWKSFELESGRSIAAEPPAKPTSTQLEWPRASARIPGIGDEIVTAVISPDGRWMVAGTARAVVLVYERA